MSDSFIGRALGKYKVEAKLGQGGMGKVYRGRQMSLNRPVAIKVLTAQMAMDPEFVERFQQEARVIATLQHENIVHIYDIDETRNADGEAIYFIVMELVDGFTLSQRPGAGRPMPAEQVRTIGVALSRALDYAHRQGIVHRDIKGANVMVTGEGQVKLMDFGIAKSAGGVKTATGSILGTPEYMAPEQARSGEVTPRSDIYSLGVLLYELATGRLPFSGSDPFAVALKHISQQAPRPAEIEPTVPPWLEAVILRSMSKDPVARFACAADVADALLQAEGPPFDPRLPAATVSLPAPPPMPKRVPSTPAAPTQPAPTHQTPTHQAPSQPAPMPQAPTQPAPSPTDAALVGPTLASPSPIDQESTLSYGASRQAPSTPPPLPGRPPASSTGPANELATEPATEPFSRAAASPPQRGSGPRGLLMAAGAAAVILLIVTAAGIRLLRPSKPAAPTAEKNAAAQPTEGVPISTGTLDPARREQALLEARAALEAGDAANARSALEPLIAANPGDAEGAELMQQIVAAERRDEALGILEEARGADPPQVEARGVEGAERPARIAAGVVRRAPAAGAPAAGAAERQGNAVETRPPRPVGELRRLAERQKEAKQYHSLKRTLDEWIATGAAPAEAHTWRGKVDRWIHNREDDLRDELEDHIDDLIDGIEDRDLDDLRDLWDRRLDRGSEAFFSRLFERYRRLEVEIRILEERPVDDRIDFIAEVSIRGRERRRDPERQIRRTRWRGRLVDDGETRFVSAFDG